MTLSSCHSPTCKCYCHTQGFSGDISQHACDLQPPAESDKQSDYVNPYTHIRSLESKLSVAVDKINKAKAFFTRQAETMHDCGMGTKDVYDFLDTL